MTFERNPNSVQFGGDHYHRAGNNQHWDMLPMLGYGWEYYLARASAYLTRVKDPELDPSKAGHFLDKLMWLINVGGVPGTFKPNRPPNVDLDHYLKEVYFPANGIVWSSLEGRAIRAIHRATTVQDLVFARELCSQLEAGVAVRRNEPPPLRKSDSYVQPVVDPLTPGWPFDQREKAEQESPTPPKFSTGNGGDYAGAGAEGSWSDKPSTPQEEHENRTFVFGDSAVAAASRPDEHPAGDALRWAGFGPGDNASGNDSSSSSSDSSSSSSSDSGSSSGGGSSD